MEDEKLKIIQQGIEANRQKFEIRKDLVGAGVPTDDFDAVYASTLGSLGKQKPVAPKVTLQTKTYIPPEFGGKVVQPPHMRSRLTLFQTICVGVIVIMLSIGGLYAGVKFLLPSSSISDTPMQWGKDRVVKEEQTQGLVASDSVLETKARATVASAKIQGGRMGSYDGVCKDIAVVAPIRCRNTSTNFVIYTALSNGTYFCEDKAEKGIVLDHIPTEGESCQ